MVSPAAGINGIYGSDAEITFDSNTTSESSASNSGLGCGQVGRTG